MEQQRRQVGGCEEEEEGGAKGEAGRRKRCVALEVGVREEKGSGGRIEGRVVGREGEAVTMQPPRRERSRGGRLQRPC
jgi:hypothetical protein